MTPVVPSLTGHALVAVDHGRRTMVPAGGTKTLPSTMAEGGSRALLSMAQHGVLAPSAPPGQTIGSSRDLDAYRRASLLGGTASSTGRLVDLLA